MDFNSADQAYTLSAFYYYAQSRLDSNATVGSSKCENFWVRNFLHIAAIYVLTVNRILEPPEYVLSTSNGLLSSR